MKDPNCCRGIELKLKNILTVATVKITAHFWKTIRRFHVKPFDTMSIYTYYTLGKRMY